MKQNENTQANANKFEREVFEALKQSGYEYLKSEAEIQDFIENFGKTQVELPDAYRNPTELFRKLRTKLKEAGVVEDQLAMAARGQKGSLLTAAVTEKLRSDLSSGKRLKSKRRAHGRGPKK